MTELERNRTPRLEILTIPDSETYELLDSGNGRKLERYGDHVLVRPEAEALWKPALQDKEWKKADAEFTSTPEENGGHWVYYHQIPRRWLLNFEGYQLWLQTTASRHLGVFPEQASQWNWIGDQVRQAGRPIKVLNLFGYTGVATLAAAQAGAKVTHVDASKKVITWAQENQRSSGLGDRSVRWLMDDALKFVQREGRRGASYDGIIMDPPKFGRGPKGEVWEFFKLMADLLEAVRKILSPSPQFAVITAYAVKASPITLETALLEMMEGQAGETSCGEIAIREKSAGRLLSTAIFARWAASGRAGKS